MVDINLKTPDIKTGSKMECALFYPSIGWPIFPCGPDEKGSDPKASILDGWQRPGVATTDPELIRALWDKEPNANIGFCAGQAGLIVVDVDVKHRAETLIDWLDLRFEKDIPPTLYAETPSGGRHEYFKGHGRSSVGTIIPGLDVDTRGERGYVLLPGSTVDAVPYTWPQGFDLANLEPIPEWIVTRLEATRQAAAEGGELDKPVNIHRATLKLKDYVRSGDVAVSGQGGNDRTYRAFAELASFDISPQRSFELIAEHWNPACVPPWDDEALMTFARNAGKYATGKGIYAKDLREDFAELIEAEQAKAANDKEPTADADTNAPHYSFRRSTIPDTRLPPKEIIPGILTEHHVGMLHGNYGTHKTGLLMEWGLAVATGSKTFGVQAKKGITGFATFEGEVETNARVAAYLKARNLKEANDFLIFNEPPRLAPAQGNEGELGVRFVAEIRKQLAAAKLPGIDLLCFETLSNMTRGFSEVSPQDMGQFIQMLKEIGKALGCAVLFSHHNNSEGGQRGTLLLSADSDAVYATERGPDDTIKLTMPKRKGSASNVTRPWVLKPRIVEAEYIVAPGGVPQTVKCSAPVIELATDAERALSLNQAKEIYHPSNIGRVLRLMGAVEGRTVTIAALALEITPREDPNLSRAELKAMTSTEIDTDRRERSKKVMGTLSRYCRDNYYGSMAFKQAGGWVFGLPSAAVYENLDIA